MRRFAFLPLLAAFIFIGVAIAQVAPQPGGQGTNLPAPPDQVSGAIVINGQPAPAGSSVIAFVPGPHTTSPAGHTTFDGFRYTLTLDSTTGACDTPGNVVAFRVNDTVANETIRVPALVAQSIQRDLSLQGIVGTPAPGSAPPLASPAGPGGTPALSTPATTTTPSSLTSTSSPTPTPQSGTATGTPAPSALNVAVTLDATICKGGFVSVLATVTDAMGKPVPDATLVGLVDFKTYTRTFQLPATDPSGRSSQNVDTGQPRGGYDIVWTVTATSGSTTSNGTAKCATLT